MPQKNPWGLAPFTITDQSGMTRVLCLSGRPRWALEQLIDAGAKGCTPIDNPAPRWSGYIHVLRSEGISIETLHEPHGGAFAGTHGRYVLLSAVMRGKLEGAA